MKAGLKESKLIWDRFFSFGFAKFADWDSKALTTAASDIDIELKLF